MARSGVLLSGNLASRVGNSCRHRSHARPVTRSCWRRQNWRGRSSLVRPAGRRFSLPHSHSSQPYPGHDGRVAVALGTASATPRARSIARATIRFAGRDMPSASGRSASRPGSQPRNLISVGAVLSWGFILVCIIVPAAILWRMRDESLRAGRSCPSGKAAQESAQATEAPSALAKSSKLATPTSRPPAQAPTTEPQFASAPLRPAFRRRSLSRIPLRPRSGRLPAGQSRRPRADKIFSTLASHWQLPTLLSTAIEPLGKQRGQSPGVARSDGSL